MHPLRFRFTSRATAFVLTAAILTMLPGCRGDRDTDGGDSLTIRIEGSDTMVNLAQAWAEAYTKENPEVSVQVSGGGSGVGITSLSSGLVDMANTSRSMTPQERTRTEQNTGKKPVEYVVAMDALAVYVHRNNPLDEISIDQLAEIYGDNGEIERWSQLGIQHSDCSSDRITLVSRQNNSGTYAYFREAILGDRRDYRLGTVDQSGSKDVVALISRTPCAIGYSGMGFLTDEVKWLEVATQPGGEAVPPSVESVNSGAYPIARPLYIYTAGEPTGPAKEFLDWILSSEGQTIVLELGYVAVDVPEESDPSDETEASGGEATTTPANEPENGA